MIHSRYVQLIAIVAGVLSIALAGAWFALSQSEIDSAPRDMQESPRLSSAVNRFVWEFRNCYGCVALPVEFDNTRAR